MADKYQTNLALLKNNDEELLNYLKAKFPVFHNSNFFFRDFQKAYNEALWAALADAAAADVRGSLALLDALHGRWVTFLRSLGGVQFQRT